MDLQVLWRVPDRPTVISVVAFVPPAVEHAHVQNAIHRRFLAAGTTSLQRRSWIIQPYVHALREEMCGMHLVVFDEGDMASHTVVGRQRINLMDEMFSVLV